MNARFALATSAVLAAFALNSECWAVSSAEAEIAGFGITVSDVDTSDGIPPTLTLDPTSAYAQYIVHGGSFANSDVRETMEFLPAASLVALPATLTATGTDFALQATATAGSYAYASLFSYANFALSPYSAVTLTAMLSARAVCDGCNFVSAYNSVYVAANGLPVSDVFFDGDADGQVLPYFFTYQNSTAVPVEIRLGLAAAAWVSNQPTIPEPATWLLLCVGAAGIVPAAARQSSKQPR